MDLFSQLSRQALGRGLTAQEASFAEQLEGLFAASIHTPDAVADALNQMSAPRPSGAEGQWSASVLMAELSAINASLDQAYVSAPGAARSAAN